MQLQGYDPTRPHSVRELKSQPSAYQMVRCLRYFYAMRAPTPRTFSLVTLRVESSLSPHFVGMYVSPSYIPLNISYLAVIIRDHVLAESIFFIATVNRTEGL